MSSLLWEDPREEPGSNFRHHRPCHVELRSVQTADRNQQRHPKKVGGTKMWLRVDCMGGSELVDMGKQSIMQMTGLSARDLRILDPMLSYPSSITGREGAIVINLENVKGIVTAHNFWLLNPKDPAVLPFVAKLKKRARDHYEANNPKMVMDETDNGVEEEGKDKLNNFPFEFVALEACLETVCNCFDDEVDLMEKEAYPALDKLTSSISRRKLDGVRHIKGRLVDLFARIHKVRELIEQLLEDSDMAEMCLTNKLSRHEEISSRVFSTNDDDKEEDEQRKEEEEEEEDDDDYGNRQRRVQERNGELEMMLEAYFVQAERALNKISTVKEYVDNTEDYVKIMLDDKQNNLLKMGINLNTASMILSLFMIMADLFGMNIHISLFKPPIPTINNRLFTVVGATGSSILMYVCAIAWYKHKGFV